ncbi:MAG: Gfo/Idh/MocA family oxidoreductase [Actinomycetota bacterium]|nr:Gfo/Idh/MocA family oxidoreductase [Actinomycetota bacterium]
MTKDLGVGIIGVDARRGWARESHVPAAQAIAGLKLVAVANQSQEAADAAAEAVGADRAYGNPEDLIADADVDIVTVAVPVPAHRDLIIAALRAGKHVVTEWPIGSDTAQTEEIASVAAESGVHTAVDLQSRMNPVAVRAAELIGSGLIGRVIRATVYSSTMGWGRQVPEEELYLEKPESGMNLTTIQTAHTVDFAIRLAGRLVSLAALTTVQYPELEVGAQKSPFHRVVADHVLLQGRLAGGGALAVQVVGGEPADRTPFRMDVVGDAGTLTVEGGAPRGFQSGLLRLSLNGKPVEVDDVKTEALPSSVVNVAGVYAALRDDIASGTFTAPSFEHAVRLSHLIDDIRASAADGRTATPTADWP